MSRTIYFDTNAYLDVFEGRRSDLYGRVEAAVRAGALQLVTSEVALTEIGEGSELPSFIVGLDRFLSLQPKWMFLTALTAREVIFAFDPHFSTPDGRPGSIMDWDNFLTLISEPADLRLIPDLRVPTPQALRTFLPAEPVKARLKYWKEQLKIRQRGFVDLRKRLGSADAVFLELVAYITRQQKNDAREFAEALHDDPTRAPAFSIDFALNEATLANAAPKWLKNQFFDHLHAGVIPYVDLFITHDQALIKKLSWYDEHVLAPRGITTYGLKVTDTWDTIEQQLARNVS